MKLTSVDLEPEEFRRINTLDKLGTAISLEDTRLSMKLPIVIKYDYIDLEDTEYHFNQPFHLLDTQMYFKMMKEISSETIDSLSDKSREYHFYRSNISGNLRKAMLKHCPAAIEASPIVYHFALYTNEEKASRENDCRSPRIYFMLGTYGFIYPLFFDPYHEINPQLDR